MAVYYNSQDPLWRRLRWSKSVFPHVVKSLEFWLCTLLHGILLAAVQLERIDLAEDASVPLQVAGPLLALAIIVSIAHVANCARRHEQIVRACAHVEEETLFFVQEVQATLGRVNDVLALRFVAAKYALSATYAFFFTITGGAMTSMGWSEIRAKGLLDDDEVRFMKHNYHGDCMALLHIWAMWAAEEAVADIATRQNVGDEVLAGGLARMAESLRSARSSAREVAGKLAVPVPYLQVQLHDSLLMLTLLLWAALSAMPVIAGYGATTAYAILLLLILGLREAASIFMEPLGPNSYGFPVAVTVNTVSDVAAQLLVASTPPGLNPSPSWRNTSKAMLTQAQLERRTSQQLFSGSATNPCTWPSVPAPTIDGDQVPPPLTGIGCCHLDTEALPQLSTKWKGHGFQVARRPTQDALGAMLQNIRAEANALEERERSVPTITSHSSLSKQTPPGGVALSWRPPQPQAPDTDEWDKIAHHIAVLPREPSLASEPVANSHSSKRLLQPTPAAWRGQDLVRRPFMQVEEESKDCHHVKHVE